MRKVVFGSSSTFDRFLRVPQNYRDYSQKNIGYIVLPKVYCVSLGKLLNMEIKNNSSPLWQLHCICVIESSSLSY